MRITSKCRCVAQLFAFPISGTLFYSYYGGEVIAETVNQANFSAFTIGNHEFDGGDDMLAAFLNNLTVPAVSTNIYTDNALLRAQLHPYLYYPEHEMALVALTTVDTPGISSPGNGTTFAPYSSVQATVDQLLQSRLGMGRGACKRVIALTHIGKLDNAGKRIILGDYQVTN